MSELTELEQEADREARHGHRELVEKLEVERDEAKNQLDSARHSVEVLEARVAELERIALDWEEAAREESNRAEHAVDEQRIAWNDAIRAAVSAAGRDTSAADRIRTLLRNEGGSDG